MYGLSIFLSAIKWFEDTRRYRFRVLDQDKHLM